MTAPACIECGTPLSEERSRGYTVRNCTECAHAWVARTRRPAPPKHRPARDHAQAARLRRML